jgi:hypothetical protein
MNWYQMNRSCNVLILNKTGSYNKLSISCKDAFPTPTKWKCNKISSQFTSKHAVYGIWKPILWMKNI